MLISFINNIEAIGQSRWNALSGIDNPFLRFEFFSALEKNNCVGKNAGWIPQHLIVEDEADGNLLAIMPLYLKYNSYGELVFDWSWADAYHQAGRVYYPKLVSAIPYTPATGERILFADNVNKDLVSAEIIKSLKQVSIENNLSSIHCLFPPESACDAFVSQGFVSRLGCQFHWHNQGYESFSQFISTFASRKRKNILKERKRSVEQGIEFKILHGNQIEADLWPHIYHFYQKTFIEKGGYASFTQAFFEDISCTMGDQLIVILAIHRGKFVASAICYRSDNVLYGRHWGCTEKFDALHFETCYYQGIDYAIENELAIFEPGAQGEHKVSRGFMPTATWSTHWIKDEDFRSAIYHFVDKEKQYMQDYISTMKEQLPFKKSDV